MKNNLFCLFLAILSWPLYSQPTINNKEDRNAATEAIQLLKSKGVIVVRLKTYQSKIAALEANLKNEKLKPSRRKELEAMLQETTDMRDAINQTLFSTFKDSFDFCPVYFCFDKDARTLSQGTRKGIFLDSEMKPDPEISLSDTAAVFVAYFHEKSGDYPLNGLILRKLNETLDEPFPAYTPIRESFVNEINTPKLKKTILFLDQRLKALYQLAGKKGKKTD